MKIVKFETFLIYLSTPNIVFCFRKKKLNTSQMVKRLIFNPKWWVHGYKKNTHNILVALSPSPRVLIWAHKECICFLLEIGVGGLTMFSFLFFLSCYITILWALSIVVSLCSWKPQRKLILKVEFVSVHSGEHILHHLYK